MKYKIYLSFFSHPQSSRENTLFPSYSKANIYIYIFIYYINRKKIPIKEAWKVSRVKYYIERIVVENQVTNVTNFLKRPSHPRSLESSKTLSPLELIFFLLSAGEHTFSSSLSLSLSLSLRACFFIQRTPSWKFASFKVDRRRIQGSRKTARGRS